MPTEPDKKKKSLLTNSSDYAKYSVMGFQMAAIIGLGVFAGIKLDNWLEFKKFPLFTILLSLVGVFGALYWVLKDFMKKK